MVVESSSGWIGPDDSHYEDVAVTVYHELNEVTVESWPDAPTCMTVSQARAVAKFILANTEDESDGN